MTLGVRALYCVTNVFSFTNRFPTQSRKVFIYSELGISLVINTLTFND